MADLLLDLPTLDQLHKDLTFATANFESIHYISHELVGAVGDDGSHELGELRHQVDEFANGWHIRRDKITAAMEAITASVKAIHDTFSAVDTKLANVLIHGG